MTSYFTSNSTSKKEFTILFASPTCGKTSLVKAWNRGCGHRRAADLDFKGMPEGDAAFDYWMAMLSTLPALPKMGYELLVMHLPSQGVRHQAEFLRSLITSMSPICDLRLIFATRTECDMLTAIGLRDGVNSGFYRHMSERDDYGCTRALNNYASYQMFAVKEELLALVDHFGDTPLTRNFECLYVELGLYEFLTSSHIVEELFPDAVLVRKDDD